MVRDLLMASSFVVEADGEWCLAAYSDIVHTYTWYCGESWLIHPREVEVPNPLTRGAISLLLC